VRYAISLAAILRDQSVTALPHLEFINRDLVRARSRAVRLAIEGDFDHLLFWDADVAADPARIGTALRHMIGTKEDVIGALYPRRDGTGLAYSQDGDNVLLPMGFTLLSRGCLLEMTNHYASELTFDDEGHDTVALFQLMLRKKRLLSEDYSFCQRWIDMGGECKIYYGATLEHSGQTVYK
jgi:hypothetical protein